MIAHSNFPKTIWMSDEFCDHFHCMAVGNIAPFRGWKIACPKRFA
jgi:hypothetical protein